MPEQVQLPPALGAPALEVVEQPLATARPVIRTFHFRELPAPAALPPLGPTEVVNVDVRATVRIAAYAFGLEVLLDFAARPNTSRMPVEVDITASALYPRPADTDVATFARRVGEIAPSALLAYVAALLPVLTGEGYYGPVRVLAQGIRVVWAGETASHSPAEPRAEHVGA